ncbi:septum formation initiator family protein, partial [Psychrobacter sp. NPDC078370]
SLKFTILFYTVWRYHLMKYFSQFILLALAVAVLLGLQYQYWLGENGRFEHNKLTAQIEEQQRLNDNQVAANNLLRTDVQDLKTGLEAVEEHARLDLGLIKPNETFVQVSTAPTTHSNY